jgi:5-methylcytosine-specific restriction endonuclease McrA
MHLILEPAKLRRRKNSAQVVRTAPSRRMRVALLEADALACGCCGRRFGASALMIDHIIPASLLGADHPSNWVSLCGRDDQSKSDRFAPHSLRY